MSEKELKELTEHVEACPTCTKAKGRVNDFCEIGVALFLAWNPEPLKVEERFVSDAELAKMEQDPINRLRTIQ